MGTHQLGAFVGAVPCEDESVFARGNGHHRCVDQAQLHDASIVASQGGCVVEADPRGVTATWWAKEQGCKSPQEKLTAAGTRSGMKNDAVLQGVWGEVLWLLTCSFPHVCHSYCFKILDIFMQVFTKWPQTFAWSPREVTSLRLNCSQER